MKKMKLIIVEDKKKITDPLSEQLSVNQFEVDVADNAETNKTLTGSISYDLAILDIRLSSMKGREIREYIKKLDRDMSVIMLTPMGTLNRKLAGPDAKPVDHLVKPFQLRELLVRVMGMLKKSSPKLANDIVVQVADLVMNLNSKQVTRNGKNIHLTPKEFQLLEYFVRNKNRVLSRADIAMNVWGIDFDTKTNVIDVYVNFLRKKIDKGFMQKLIFTYAGQGYVLSENELK